MKNQYDDDFRTKDKNIINLFPRNTPVKNENIKNPFLKLKKTKIQKTQKTKI